MAKQPIVKVLLEESNAEVTDLRSKQVDANKKLRNFDERLAVVINARTEAEDTHKAALSGLKAMLERKAISQQEHDAEVRELAEPHEKFLKDNRTEEAAIREEAKPIVEDLTATIQPALRIAQRRVTFYEKRLGKSK